MNLSDVTFKRVPMEQVGTMELPALPAERSGSGAGANPIISETLEKGGFFTPAPIEDGAGNIFLAFVVNTGREAYVRVVKELPDGRVAPGGWEFRCEPINGIAHKGDHVGMVQRGDGVRVYLSSHALNEGPRVMAIWRGVEAGIAVPKATSGGFTPGPEPCVLPDKLSYFRLGAPVSRGQAIVMMLRLVRWLAKFIQLPVVIPAKRKFQDVDASSAFYEAAQWGSEVGVISGYPCKEG